MTESNYYEKAGAMVQPIALCIRADFIEGNIIKYLCRYQHKGDPEGDLEKAREYANLLLGRLEHDGELQGCIDISFCLLGPFREKHPLLGLWLDDDGFYTAGSTGGLIDAINAELDTMQAEATPV